MAADVSVEALEKVKESAQQFGESVAKISADIVSQNETAMDDCKNAIHRCKKDLEAVIKTIQALDQQIYAKASEISHANNEIANLKNQIASFQSKLAAIESRIAMLENQRAQLQAQLSDTDGEERKKQIQQQINEVQRAISNCHAEESELRGKVNTAKYQIEELQSKISSLKAEMAKLEQERDREKVRKDKMADKLERMSRSFSTLSADLNEYTNAVKKFESKSASNMNANVSAIDKCITAIESYLAVRLASRFVASSSGLGGSSGGGGSTSGGTSGSGNNITSNQGVGASNGSNNNVSSSQTNNSGIGMMMATCMGTLAAMGIPNCTWVQNAVANSLTSQGGGISSGNGSSSGDSNLNNNPQVTSTCEQVANSFIEHCITSTNPNYSSGEEWQHNCYLCVPACEANRRGGNITARSATGVVENMDDLAYQLASNPFDAWQNPDVINIESTNSQGNEVSPIREISRQMRQWGNGSRAEIAVYWTDEMGIGGGHVFLAEFRNDSIHFSDPQTGDCDTFDWFANFDGFVEHGGMLTEVSFCRIDTLQFNSRYINRCYTEGGR